MAFVVTVAHMKDYGKEYKQSGVRLKLSDHDCECLLLAVNFWLENVSQEDTDKETFLTLVDLREAMLWVCRTAGREITI